MVERQQDETEEEVRQPQEHTRQSVSRRDQKRMQVSSGLKRAELAPRFVGLLSAPLSAAASADEREGVIAGPCIGAR